MTKSLPLILLARCQNTGLSDWFSRLIKNPPIRAQGSVADLNVKMKVTIGATELFYKNLFENVSLCF